MHRRIVLHRIVARTPLVACFILFCRLCKFSSSRPSVLPYSKVDFTIMNVFWDTCSKYLSISHRSFYIKFGVGQHSIRIRIYFYFFSFSSSSFGANVINTFIYLHSCIRRWHTVWRQKGRNGNYRARVTVKSDDSFKWTAVITIRKCVNVIFVRIVNCL